MVGQSSGSTSCLTKALFVEASPNKALDAYALRNPLLALPHQHVASRYRLMGEVLVEMFGSVCAGAGFKESSGIDTWSGTAGCAQRTLVFVTGYRCVVLGP